MCLKCPNSSLLVDAVFTLKTMETRAKNVSLTTLPAPVNFKDFKRSFSVQRDISAICANTDINC